MTILNIEDSLILIIDIQEKLANAVFNKQTLISKAEIIAKASNILNIPVIVTEQYPQGLGETIDCIKNHLNKDTKFFEKISFSALDNNDIKSAIKNTGRKQVIICGIETHICVNQTVRALTENNFEVNIIKDACGSRTEYEHTAGLERLVNAGAHILTTEIALFEWLKSAKHPNFKEIQSLIK